MAPMKRERQWDMFDVATGACELDDYLNQRYSENDLQSKFWVEEKDQVDELRPPAHGSKEQIVIPVQGPNVGPPKPPSPVDSAPLPSRPPWEAATEPLPTRPAWETPAPTSAGPPAPTAAVPPQLPSRPAPHLVQGAPANPPVQPPPAAPPAASSRPSPPAPEPIPEAEPEPPAAAPPSMAELLAQFHQATRAYEERAKDELPEDSDNL